MSYALILMLWACGGSAGDVSPEAVAAVADAIEANPSGADKALEEAGFTRASFDDALYAIAKDQDLTKRYLAARK